MARQGDGVAPAVALSKAEAGLVLSSDNPDVLYVYWVWNIAITSWTGVWSMAIAKSTVSIFAVVRPVLCKRKNK